MKKILVTIIIAFALIPNLAFADITSNLQLQWPFNEGSGSTATDASGNGRDGTISGAVYAGTGIIGADSLFFDEIDDRVSVASFAEANQAQSGLTVAAWVYSTSTAQGRSAAIVTKQRSLAGFSGWAMWKNTSEQFVFQIRNTGSGTTTAQQSAISDSAYTDTGWHHVVGVYDRAFLTIYVDGVEADSTPAATTIDLANDTGQLCVGGGRNATVCDGTSPWGGGIDEVRIFNRALSSSDVAELYLYTEGGGGGAPEVEVETPAFMEF